MANHLPSLLSTNDNAITDIRHPTARKGTTVVASLAAATLATLMVPSTRKARAAADPRLRWRAWKERAERKWGLQV